jgi:hypothetical protein
MELVTYLKNQLTDKPYEWSIDVSWSGSTYINYEYGTEEQEDEGYTVRTSIRFSDHTRPSVVSNDGVFDHDYLQDFRVENGIPKGFVDAILKYADLLILEAQQELANDDFICISWSRNHFTEILDGLKNNNQYSTELLYLGVE